MEKNNQPENPVKDKPLKDMELHINEFGQIVRDVKLDEITEFLNENVPDKKLDECDEGSDM